MAQTLAGPVGGFAYVGFTYEQLAASVARLYDGVARAGQLHCEICETAMPQNTASTWDVGLIETRADDVQLMPVLVRAGWTFGDEKAHVALCPAHQDSRRAIIFGNPPSLVALTAPTAQPAFVARTEHGTSEAYLSRVACNNGAHRFDFDLGRCTACPEVLTPPEDGDDSWKVCPAEPMIPHAPSACGDPEHHILSLKDDERA